MAQILTPGRFATPTRQPAAVTVADDLIFAGHLLDTTVPAWLAGTIPNEDRYAVTCAERAVLHATLTALGAVTWSDPPGPAPQPTAAYLAECAQALRGGSAAPSVPLPAEVGTYRYVKGVGVVVTPLEDN